jgi:outer membrane protein assembly factor BamB
MIKSTFAVALAVLSMANASPTWMRKHGCANSFDHEHGSFRGFGGGGSFESWNGWGGGIFNRRMAQGTKVNPDNIGKLDVVCKVSYTDGESAAPTINGDMAYYPTWGGQLVALNYKTCETLWTTNITQVVLDFAPVSAGQLSVAQTVSRTTPYLFGDHLYVGTLLNALLLAVDVRTGAVVARKQLSDHPMAVITQSPTVFNGRVFVGVSSAEESAAALIPGYKCCSFVGTFQALYLDCASGTFHTDWSVSMLPTPRAGWSGNAVWGSQPSIDEPRGQVYIATGNVYKAPKKFEDCAKKVDAGKSSGLCLPKDVLQEAVVALDMETGHINWVRRLSALDAWTVACLPGAAAPGNKKNCPPAPGPDADFGMAPAYVLGSSAKTPGGKDTLVVGQKNGNLYAIAAEDGSLQWTTVTSPDGVAGGLSWGVAVDESRVYFTGINFNEVGFKLPNGKKIKNSAWGAANLTDGKLLWETEVTPDMSLAEAPPTTVDGLMIAGRTSPQESGPKSLVGGELVVLDAASGHVMNTMPLDAPYHGGVAISENYLLFGSGYSNGFYNTTGSFYVVKVGA